MDPEEEKQNYLRENIIDKGYDADDFVTFLGQRKGLEIEEGIDLNDFSLDELKTLVQDFITSLSEKSQQKIESTTQNYPQIQNNFQQNIPNTNPLNTANPLENPIMNTNNQNMNMIYSNNINSQNNMYVNQNNNTNNMFTNTNTNLNISSNNTNLNIPNNNVNIPNNNINMPNNNNNLNMPNNSNLNIPNNNSNIPNNNFNMGMNSGMNMNFTMNNNLTINNNINFNNNLNNGNINSPSTTSDNNMNIQQISISAGQNRNESADIYGITNLDSISCSLMEKSELSKYDNIQIEMSLGEKVARKAFSKAYMTFLITTSPLNLNVHRRYSDFEWLRQILHNLYPGSIIPPIPKKKGNARFDELFLLKRKRNLERFLICLVDDQEIKCSQILYDFLSIEKEKDFNDKKKYYNSIKMPKKINEYQTLNGKLDIAINEENELYYKSIKEYTDKSQDLLTKFNKNIKLLDNEISIVVKRFDEISHICEQLFHESVKYFDTDNIKISYYQLKNMFKDWSNLLKKQSCLVNVNIREYFKYTRNTFRSVKELTNNVDNYKDNYYKAKKNLITKKEELFKKNDPRKWDLGPDKDNINPELLKDKNIALQKILYKETNNVIDLKQIYGYYLNRVLTEYVRIRKYNGEGQKQNVMENAKFQSSIISELFKNISDIATCNTKYDIKNIEKELNINIG